MTTYTNYFSALSGLSDTVVLVAIVVNFALCLTALWTKFVIAVFLNSLSNSEMQSIYQRGWIFLCNSSLYWGTINRDLYMNPFNLGVCLSSILVIFVLHWVCRMRVRGLQAVADTNSTWGRIMTIARSGLLCVASFAADVSSCYTAVQSLRQHNYALLSFGSFIVDQLEMSLVFCSEYIINVSSLVFLHSNPDEEWEFARTSTSVCLLGSSLVAVTGHAMFIYVFGFRMSDIGSLFARLVRLNHHVEGATKVFTAKSEISEFTTAATAEESERDSTCVICREEMSMQMANDSKNAARTLRCGHVMHSKCSTAWISQSATCPTCRRNVRPPANASSSNSQETNQPEEVQPVAVQDDTFVQPSQDGNVGDGSDHQDAPLMEDAHEPRHSSDSDRIVEPPLPRSRTIDGFRGVEVHQVDDIRQVEIQQAPPPDAEIQQAESGYTDQSDTSQPGGQPQYFTTDVSDSTNRADHSVLGDSIIQGQPSSILDPIDGVESPGAYLRHANPEQFYGFMRTINAHQLRHVSSNAHSPPLAGHLREFVRVQRYDATRGIIGDQFEFRLQ